MSQQEQCKITLSLGQKLTIMTFTTQMHIAPLVCNHERVYPEHTERCLVDSWSMRSSQSLLRSILLPAAIPHWKRHPQRDTAVCHSGVFIGSCNCLSVLLCVSLPPTPMVELNNITHLQSSSVGSIRHLYSLSWLLTASYGPPAHSSKPLSCRILQVAAHQS